jgi:hypothetical protein
MEERRIPKNILNIQPNKTTKHRAAIVKMEGSRMEQTKHDGFQGTLLANNSLFFSQNYTDVRAV